MPSAVFIGPIIPLIGTSAGAAMVYVVVEELAPEMAKGSTRM